MTGRERVHLKYQQSRKAEEVGRKGSRTRNSQREEKEKDRSWREGKIERGYSPDTSLVRGVRALHMGRWFEPQKCGRVCEIADGS